MNLRKSALRKRAASTLGIAAAVAAIGATALTSPAAAAPAPAQGWFQGGSLAVVGQNAWCNGVVDTHIETDVERPGTAIVTLVSRGMNGNGPEWAANPKCKLDFTITTVDSAAPFFHYTNVPAEFGTNPGELVKSEIRAASGLAQISVGLPAVDPVTWQASPQGSPTNASGYFVIP